MKAHTIRHALFATLVPLAVAAVAFGCDSRPATAPEKPFSAPTPAPPPTRLSIVGTVTLSSTQKPSPTGGVVYLEDAPKGADAPMTARVAIHHKEFVPFIAVLTAGGTASFENTDPVPHHIFSPDVPGWDTGYLKHDHPLQKLFDKPGPVALLCNIHPEMLGYLLVIPSGSFGLFGPDGNYVVGDVPPGTYKATAWVPRATTATESVTVSASGPVTADFEVQPPDTTH
jgi:plastocyanin